MIPSLLAPAPRLADPALLVGIRRDLPILIASGDADPLAGGAVHCSSCWGSATAMPVLPM